MAINIPPLNVFTPFKITAAGGVVGIGDYANEGPRQWNTITIGPIEYPGICKVRGSKPLKVHQKEPGGEDGAQTTQQGFRAGAITLTFTIADYPGQTAQWDAFQQIVALLQPRQGQPIQGIDVYHPALALYGIRSLYLISLGLVEPRSENEPDILISRIEMSQYTPLKARGVNTAKTATPSTPSYTAQISPAEAAGNLSVAPSADAFTPGSNTPPAGSTPANASTDPGATYNPDSGFTPTPGSLDAPSASQSGPPSGGVTGVEPTA